MICGTGLDFLQSSDTFPCAVCCTGVGSNSIFCKGCKQREHKKCSGLKCLTEDPDSRCTQCQRTAHPQDTATIRSTALLALLCTEDLNLILKERPLRWYGHVEHSNGAVETAFDMQVDGKHGPGRPKMTLKQLTGRKLSAIDTHDRDTWRFGVSSAMRAATQLPDGGLTVMDIACVPAC